jgi:lipopolysaccharide transport system permease protein
MKDVIILVAGRPERHYWRDLWRYRELFEVLAWRDLSVRYKQTAIGVLWAVIRPLLAMLVFSTVFGRIARLPSDGGVPYPLMVFAALLPWTLFATGLTEASNSLINNSNLISKVYFPRLIVPVATVVASFVDFLISFVILIVLMVWYRFVPGWQMLFLPVFVFLALATSIGPSSDTSSRLLCSSACTFRQSGSHRTSCLSGGDCSILLTRWLGLLMASAGVFWVNGVHFTSPVCQLDLWSLPSSCG